MDRALAMQTLEDGLKAGKVSDKDKGFAESLVSQGKGRGLSDKQWYWVVKLASAVAGEKQYRAVGDFGGVYALFNKAKAHLKYPKIVLQLPSGTSVKLYLSGTRSRVPNTVNVVANDSGSWYGRVAADGAWTEGHVADVSGEVAGMLTRLAAQPEEVAAEYGKLTGNCCFCSRPLTDDRSTEVGYGPVCASHYGLKWGVK